MEEYTCMIVDDEQDAIDYMVNLINDNCPQLKIIATATKSDSAIKKYFQKLPDLLFMDIEVDEKNGFEILNEIYHKRLNPYTIFVTAYNKYAIEAFRSNAIDYLLKPCNPEELTIAVQKFIDAKEKDLQYLKIQTLIIGENQKIRLNTRTGFILVHPGEIIYCEADRNYSKIYTSENRIIHVTLNMAKIENKLPFGKFWRISRSLLVNSDFITEVKKKEKIVLIRVNGKQKELIASKDMLRKL